MQNNTVETLMAAAVILFAAGFLFFAYTTTHGGAGSSYDIRASLSSVDGIAASSDVRLHGIKIGTVSSVDLDTKTYKPVVHLSIRDDIPIPVDSSARIASSGVNGNPFLSVQPGRSTKMLADGAAWKAN